MSIHFASILVCVVLFTGSAFGAAPDDEPAPEASTPEAYFPEEIPFSDEQVREIFIAVDIAARKVAKADWKNDSRGKYLMDKSSPVRDANTYRTTWTFQAKDPELKKGTRIHQISIELNIGGSPPVAKVFQLQASLYRADDWNGFLMLRCGRDKTKRYYFTSASASNASIFQDRLPKDLPFSDPSLRFGANYTWGEFLEENRIHYSFGNSRISRAPGFGAERSQLAKAQAIFGSPESLRELGLDEIARAEANMKAEIAAGTGLRMNPLPGGDRKTLEPNEKMPDAIREKLQTRALQRMQLSRTILKEHHRDIQAAIVAAFPAMPEIVAKMKE